MNASSTAPESVWVANRGLCDTVCGGPASCGFCVNGWACAPPVCSAEHPREELPTLEEIHRALNGGIGALAQRELAIVKSASRRADNP